ncbi:VIT family protein [Rhodopirellula sp. SWK7]|uniref:VIT1/CCC1 transporter family protein n=1 Tax=Rhodopirellula sp. SWK7 TaxID=595460 RepID=UPI0002BF5345|nr:VIT family protein [Rhodopirellula sp. SWK7]EMI40820.1 Nodulin 21-like protein [Rhodopirellula sp. SWK7]
MTHHQELHRTDRIGWLRAAVLGANDGILSVGSVLIGVASASTDRQNILLAGVAALTAGAMSMAAGEYVSVSSQSDTENADRRREAEELRDSPESELDELTQIYVHRGLDEPLARQVAIKLTEKDAIGTHLRDELGISEHLSARPLQAAWTSALAFAIGAALPVAVALLSPARGLIIAVAASTLLSLGILGGVSAGVGGASVVRGTLRVAFWGAAAMGASSLIGWIFGVSVG